MGTYRPEGCVRTGLKWVRNVLAWVRNVLAWARNVWVRNVLDYETTGKRTVYFDLSQSVKSMLRCDVDFFVFVVNPKRREVVQGDVQRITFKCRKYVFLSEIFLC